MIRETPNKSRDLFHTQANRCETELPGEHKVAFPKLRLLNPLHLVASMLQLIVGSCVIMLAMVGLITPLWVAAIMSMLGSALFMTGGYMLYDTFKERSSVSKLARNSVRRIIREQN